MRARARDPHRPACARLDEVQEDVARLEHAGIIGEHAEHDPHEEPFKIVPSVSCVSKRVMQPPDQFRGLDVRRVLVAERPALHPEDETERLDMRRQVREREGDGFPFVKIAKPEGLEVAHQDVARALAVRQRVEVLPGLFVCRRQVQPGALLVDDEHARPEQVDEAGSVAELRDMLLEAGDITAAFPEDLEELVVEALRLALLVCRVPPVCGEGGRAGANLVPRQAHGLHRFLIEVVFVDPLDLASGARPHANSVPDHQACKFRTVDQDDALRAPRHVVPGGAREVGNGDEHALGRACGINCAREVAQVAFAHGVSFRVLLRLHVDLVQAERVLPERPVNAAIPRTSRDAALCGIAVAVAHRDQQIHDRLFEKCRRGIADPLQNVDFPAFPSRRSARSSASSGVSEMSSSWLGVTSLSGGRAFACRRQTA